LSGNKFGQNNRQPVVKVSWHGAVAFCKWLTHREREAGRLPADYQYRLPTEAEWEYAARAGTRTAYSWGDAFGRGHCNAENNKGSSGKNAQCSYFAERNMRVDSIMLVGRFDANRWGLYDMHGNVWEWCYDWYDRDYYSDSPRVNPVNTSKASDRVIRGGGWHSTAGRCRSAYRYRNPPDNPYYYVGFRVVLAPPVQR